MTWEGFYLFCFALGLCLSAVAFVGGFSHFHVGHMHLHHLHLGKAGHVHVGTGHGGNSNAVSPMTQ